VIVMRVSAEDPVVSLRGRNCHRGFESALYTSPTKKRNKMSRTCSFFKRYDVLAGQVGEFRQIGAKRAYLSVSRLCY
jgi:hypothetical protein